MRALIVGAALTAFALPLPATAQDYPDDSRTAELAERLSDPATQDAMASTVRALSEVLLDMPLAPMMEAAAEMAGEDPADVDPDATLRTLSPEAERVPDEISEKLPQMMGMMAGMARGMEAMLPALREMAERMEDATRDAR